AQNILEDRAVLDDLMRNDPAGLEIGFAVGIAQLPLRQVVGETKRHVAAFAGEHVEEQAEVLRTSGDIVEHHTGTILVPQHRLGSEAYIFLPTRRADMANLAEALGIVQPFTEIVIGDMGGKVFSVAHHCVISSQAPLATTPHARSKSLRSRRDRLLSVWVIARWRRHVSGEALR